MASLAGRGGRGAGSIPPSDSAPPLVATKPRAMPWNDQHVNALTGAFVDVTASKLGPGSSQGTGTLWGNIFSEFTVECPDNLDALDGSAEAGV